MRFLSPHECVEWCGLRAYPTTQHPGYSQPTASDSTNLVTAAFALPEDSGRKVALGRLLFSLLEPADEYLLWLGEWGVWESSQHMPLVSRLRQAHGEIRPLIEAPGLLFTPAESDDALSFLVVALLFIWDCHVFSSSGAEALHVSHDEHGWYGSRTEFRTARAEHHLSAFVSAGSA
jgi:hypothetical protein